jgi:hypothetical protein
MRAEMPQFHQTPAVDPTPFQVDQVAPHIQSRMPGLATNTTGSSWRICELQPGSADLSCFFGIKASEASANDADAESYITTSVNFV